MRLCKICQRDISRRHKNSVYCVSCAEPSPAGAGRRIQRTPEGEPMSTADLSIPQVIAQLRAKGWKIMEIARHLETSEQVVMRWQRGTVRPHPYNRMALANMLVLRSPGADREQEHQSTAEVIRALETIGWPLKVIAERTGVHPETLRRYKHAVGLPTPPVRRILDDMLLEPPPSTSEQVLINLLAAHAQNGVYQEGYVAVGKLLGYTDAGVHRLMHRLQAQGYITRLSGEPGAKSRWRVNVKPNVAEER